MMEDILDYKKRIRNIRRTTQSQLTWDKKVVSKVSPYDLASVSTRKKSCVKSVANIESASCSNDHTDSNPLNSEADGSEQVLDSEHAEESEEADEYSISLDDDVNYRHRLLHDSSATVLVNDKILALRSYSTVTGKLDNKHYFAIVKVDGVLYCSCNEETKYVLSSAKILVNPKECVHRAIAEAGSYNIEEWFHRDDHSYGENILGENSTNVFFIDEGTVLVYCASTKAFSTVYLCGSNLQCRCTRHKGPCLFIQHVQKVLSSGHLDEGLMLFKEAFEAGPSYIEIKEQASVSWKCLPLAAKSVPSPSDGMKVNGAECISCSGHLLNDDSRHYLPVICYDTTATYNLQVERASCVGCQVTACVDGSNVGILNMGNYAITHQVMYDYLRFYLTDGLTLCGYYKNWIWRLLTADVAARPTYTKFRLAWISFTKLLNFDYFVCSLCGDIPSIVVCDGMALGFRFRHRISKESTADETPVGLDVNLLSGCSHSETMVIRSRGIRKLLKSVLESSETNELQLLLLQTKSECTFLIPILSAMINEADLPTHWRTFLRELTKDTPAIGLAQCCVGDLKVVINKLLIHKSTSELKELNILSPVLCKFFVDATDRDLQLAGPIVNRIYECMQYVESFAAHRLPLETKGKNFASDAHFPKLMLHHQRGLYVLDKTKSALKGGNSCTKFSGRHRTLLPGIFTIHCHHGVCYGFQVMDQAESPNVPFTVFRTRFAVAPEVIIYDNSCNLHKYCLNRDPGFFKKTKFLVDRFHWNNHTACSSGYDVDAYMAYNKINSQVAEQRNATLSRLKATLSYQTEENFIRNLALYLAFRNLLKDLSRRKPVNECEVILKELALHFGDKTSNS